VVTSRQGPEAPSGQPAPPPASPSATTVPFKREFRSLGSKVIESDQAFEEPPAEDLWEGEKFEVCCGRCGMCGHPTLQCSAGRVFGGVCRQTILSSASADTRLHTCAVKDQMCWVSA
jgi:hypothetical protein